MRYQAESHCVVRLSVADGVHLDLHDDRGIIAARSVSGRYRLTDPLKLFDAPVLWMVLVDGRNRGKDHLIAMGRNGEGFVLLPERAFASALAARPLFQHDHRWLIVPGPRTQRIGYPIRVDMSTQPR